VPVWYNRRVNHSITHKIAAISALTLLIISNDAPHVAAQPGKPVSQAKINDYAAAIERCRRDILESPHLRNRGETLPAYMNRICASLPAESRTQYLHRVAGYVRSMEQAVEATEGGRIVPTLVHADAGNTAHWARISKDLGYLPKRIEKVRDAWRAAEHASDLSTTGAKLGSEMAETLQLMLDAFGHLRDAAP